MNTGQEIMKWEATVMAKKFSQRYNWSNNEAGVV